MIVIKKWGAKAVLAKARLLGGSGVFSILPL